MEDISKYTGLSVHTVRRHQRDGWFDMKDFISVVKYVAAQMTLFEIAPKEERRS